MDREIPKEVRQKERNKKIIRYSAIGVAGVIVVSVLISLMRVGVEEKRSCVLYSRQRSDRSQCQRVGKGGSCF